MVIDCESCEVRPIACGDCVIGVLLGMPAPRGVPSGASTVQFDAPERRALEVLADQGLVPRLRLVAPVARSTTAGDDAAGEVRDVG